MGGHTAQNWRRKGFIVFVTSPGPKQPQLRSAAACQISFAAALGPWLTTVDELRIWPISCHIPLHVRKNAARVRRSGYPQTLMDRPAGAVFRVYCSYVRCRATAVGASAEVSPTLASLLSPLQPGPGAD